MLNAKKSLSQNFLNDKNISNKIVRQTILKNKIVIEIGPGYGFMTDSILKMNPKKIILIEKDYSLVKFLKNKYRNNKNIVIIESDILKYNFENYKNLIILSNLPYNISSKVILYLFNFNQNISEMILMIQKEVAEKFDYNIKNMNKYKFLTRIVSDYKRCFNVPPNVFIPRPKVNSTVVKFTLKARKIDLNKAYKFSDKIFKNIRKKINNNLKIVDTNNLLNRRINELTIKELLTIYNSF